jgi:alpha,alpha-trehalase
MFDEETGLFYDYQLQARARSSYVAPTALYPLWATARNVCDISLVTKQEAQDLVRMALSQLEAPGGLLASSPRSLKTVKQPSEVRKTAAGELSRVVNQRQWEAPNGWAPHQMLAWEALRAHGHEADAQRLAYRWLHLITTSSADFHGTVPEKFDVVARSHQVFAEYGNVGTDFSYIAEEGFGWMNASYLVGLSLLSDEQRRALGELRPPEELLEEGLLQYRAAQAQ